MSKQTTTPTQAVRIDKWLWAARLFKTRSMAKNAVEGGKVHYNSQRVKSSKNITVGATLTVRLGWDERTLIIDQLSDKRGSASDAQKLYHETEQSLAAREANSAARRAARASMAAPDRRPTKKQRRQIHKFKNIHE